MEFEETAQSIGKAIAELRKKKGYSQRKLASLCDMSYATLANIEVGKTNPTIATLNNLLNHIDGEIKVE